MSISFKIWPWELGEKPLWINPENGYEWYIEESLTKSCYDERQNGLNPINAVCFIVVDTKNNEHNPVSRVLIDKNTNSVLHDDTSLEGMACKIDFLRLAQTI